MTLQKKNYRNNLNKPTKSIWKCNYHVGTPPDEKMKLVNPITCVVSLSILSKIDKYQFQHSSSVKERTDLQAFLRVEELLNFSFKGWLVQSKRNNYNLQASFKATVVQNCVITSKPVKTKIENTIKRYYADENKENSGENLAINLNSREIEPIHRQLDISAVIVEALCLRIPDYPRKKNVKFEGVTITGNGLKPIEKTLSSPFSILKDYPTK